MADFARKSEEFFVRMRLLRQCESVSGPRNDGGASQQKANDKGDARRRGAIFSHNGYQLLFSSILYVPERSCNALARPRYPRKNGTIARAGRYIHQ